METLQRYVKAGSTRRTNALHRTETAISFLHSHGYERLSAARTRAVDISQSPHEEPRAAFVHTSREADMGLETKTLLLCCRCYALRPKAKNESRATDPRDRRETKKGAPILLFFAAEAVEKWCRLIPTMRPSPWLFSRTPGSWGDWFRVGKTLDQITPTVGPNGQGPAKDKPEPNKPGCLSLQTSAG